MIDLPPFLAIVSAAVIVVALVAMSRVPGRAGAPARFAAVLPVAIAGVVLAMLVMSGLTAVLWAATGTFPF